jgi:HAMP domain-containing protein
MADHDQETQENLCPRARTSAHRHWSTTMSSSDTKKPRQTSLARRFNTALATIYLISVVVSLPLVYWYTSEQVKQQAAKELSLLVDVVKSVQNYVATSLRPHMMEKKDFYSPAFSGIVATSLIAEHLRTLQPQYYIKVASDNPLNPANQAVELELDLLKDFRRNRGLGNWQETGLIGGKPYLVAASPKISNKKGCLRCHGKPEDAPEDVIKTYGRGSGYYYQMDDVVGVSLVGVPLAEVRELAIQRSLGVAGGLTVVFGLLFLVVNLLVRRLIINPMGEITAKAHAVSRGQVDQKVEIDRNDEIGEVARSFELMRRSLVLAMKHRRDG